MKWATTASENEMMKKYKLKKTVLKFKKIIARAKFLKFLLIHLNLNQ